MLKKNKPLAVTAFALLTLCAITAGACNFGRFWDDIGTLMADAGEGKTITVPGSNLEEKLEWLDRYIDKITENNRQENSDSWNGDFIVEVDADETISSYIFSGYGYRPVEITITFKGIGANRTISLYYFEIRSGITLILDNNITFKKLSGDNRPVVGNESYQNYFGTLIMNEGSAISGGSVSVETIIINGGKISGNTYAGNNHNCTVSALNFTMNGGEISGNTSGGVFIRENGTFTMTGGEISGNTGGGVFLEKNAAFTMNNGKISGNSDSGVSVGENAVFTMNSGEISGNTVSLFSSSSSSTSSSHGGGVYVGNGSFTMNSGKISGNTSFFSSSASYSNSSSPQSGGGGVYVSGGTFTMNGGEISGNTAAAFYNAYTYTPTRSSYGGGVYVGGGNFRETDSDEKNGTFIITGGTISGNTADFGGGVYVASRRTYIDYRTAYVWGSGIFTMTGGSISGNVASSNSDGANISYGNSTDNTGSNGDN